MTFAGARSFFLYQLIIVSMAVLVYWTYYHSLDPQTTSSYTGATFDSASAVVNGFIDHQRVVIMGWWHGATDWRSQIYNNLTTP